jgi:glycosyltransferase involved in cell wall biosynthesis
MLDYRDVINFLFIGFFGLSVRSQRFREYYSPFELLRMYKQISFCSTCRNRLWQLKDTLPHNLDSISDEHDIVLVDYGSTDGLSDWIWNNFSEFIENKRLVFFEVKNEVIWNVSRAKNLAHRLASGDYLFNLDADNFLTPSDIKIINECRMQSLNTWQFSGIFPDGSYGRIGVPKKIFDEVGGYDETLLPMGSQDFDLLRRIESIQKIIKITPPAISAIQNNSNDKVKEIIKTIDDEKKSSETYRLLNNLNFAISNLKLKTEGPIRVGGGFSYRGLLNGKAVTINGFNDIQHEAE